MSNTYLIDEVRAIRHKIAAECDNNLERIALRAKATVERLGLQTAHTA
ncbi:MAG: hypothetical protein MJ109_02390 [Kiritimatiellae bacterium]|nr:hypothetical protein [Kiritimatiellia bacterium]